MKFLISLMLMIFSSTSFAHCAPAPFGTGTKPIWKLGETGAWAAWYCADRFEVKLSLYATMYDAVTPEMRQDLTNISTAADPAQAIRTMLSRHSTLNIQAEPLRSLWQPHWDEIEALKPRLNPWVVQANGVFPTRPAYGYTWGGVPARSTTSIARATVGAPCDMSERFVEGKSVYGKVSTGVVALCVERAP